MKTIFIICILYISSFAQYETNAKARQVGDTLQFYSTSYIDYYSPLNPPQKIIIAECMGIGNYCYVYKEKNLQIDQLKIDQLINKFDSDYAPRLQNLYGNIPDVFDNDPKIYIVIYKEDWWGYFDPANQMPDTMVNRIWGVRSNQKEILFLTHLPFAAGMEQMTAAHELGHMIHWANDHSPEPVSNPVKYWEDVWLDECFSTFAAAYLTENLDTPDIPDQEAFFCNNYDVSLVHFISNGNYNASKLFLMYLYEHFGKDQLIRKLIAEQKNGIEGVTTALNSLGYQLSFDEIFVRWVISNYADNSSFSNGDYSYMHYNFNPPLLTSSHNSFPTGNKSSSLSAYSSRYIRFITNTDLSGYPLNTMSYVPITIRFEGDITSKFKVSALLYRANSEKMNNRAAADSLVGIVHIELDSLNKGSFLADSFGITYNKIILAVMNTDANLGEGKKKQFTYSAFKNSTKINEDFLISGYSLSQNFPNPFNPETTINIQIPKSEKIEIRVYDLLGNQVEELLNEEKAAGSYSVKFDGKKQSSGIYFCRMIAGRFSKTILMNLIK